MINMIKTIITIIKVTIIIAGAGTTLYALLWLFGFIDFSIILWISEIFGEITWDISIILNYPNVWILISYFIMKDLLFLGIELLIGSIDKVKTSKKPQKETIKK